MRTGQVTGLARRRPARAAGGVDRLAIELDPDLADLYRIRGGEPAPRERIQDGTITIQLSGIRGLPRDANDPAADISLSGTVPWWIEARGGLSRLRADLRRGTVRGIDLRGGVGGGELWLPAPTGTVPIRIAGGMSEVTIRRPVGAAIRVSIRGGASRLVLDNNFVGAIGGETSWETPNFDRTADRYDVEVRGGASSLTVNSE